MTSPNSPDSELTASDLTMATPGSSTTFEEQAIQFSPSWNYERTVADVEAIINRIELGELELADVFHQFTTAVDQLRQCETFLTRQQQQVDLLIETLLDEPETF